MTRHYIRIDNNKNIIKAFSDKFEQPENNDICVNEDGGRHFNLDLLIDNIYKYKWKSKKIVEKTIEEIDIEKLPELRIDKKAERKDFYKQLIIEDLLNNSPLLNDYNTEIQEIDNLNTVDEINNYKKD